MSSNRPTTQRDVAQACGLHPSTVCLALKDSPSIPLATRQRIQAVAQELGYQPNVAARNLALLRTEKQSALNLPLAWINQELRRDHWRADPQAAVYFEGARRRAEGLGYHLEEIWTREPGMSPARVVQIVRARGIDGVIFPVHRSCDFALPEAGWNECSLIAFNDHRLGEWMDVVCPDFFRNVDRALRRLGQRGFQRIGLVLSTRFDAASQGLVHSSYLRHQTEWPARHRLPVCFVGNGVGDAVPAVGAWLDEHEPDAVITSEGAAAAVVQQRGSAAACVQLHGTGAEFDAAVDENGSEIAAAAIDYVVQKMRRFEKGIRDTNRLHLIRGTWSERGSLRPPVESVVA